MASCKICNRVFRDDYNLHRHMSRLVPCVLGKYPSIYKKNINIAPNTSEEGQKTPEPCQKTPGECQKTPGECQNTPGECQNTPGECQKTPEPCQKTPPNKCEFCLICYSSKRNLKRHQDICKYRYDPIRLLEIENDIKVETFPKTECRFCNKDFINVNKLNNHFKICKEREDYHQKLIKNKTTTIGVQNNIQTQNNNNNTNNGVINNYNINVFGQESLEHIQVEKTIDLLRKIRLDYDTNDVYLSAGELIISFDNYIREIPENNNIVVPDSKCLYANVKTEDGWEKFSVDNMLNKGFKNTAKSLYKNKETIDNHNKKVFESNTNKEIFTEIKQFADRGFSHSKYGDTKARQVKSSYKISKLKNKKVLDF
jgi:hypothetical protein